KESGNPYHLQLYDFLGVATLGVLGQRVTLEPIMTAGMNWEAFTPPMILHQVQSISENKDLVLQAEQQLSQVDWTLGDKILRYYDRMVFAWQDLDASAFIESLNKQNLKVVQNAMQTTSLVYWGGLRCMEWLQSYAGLNSQLIRGLVVIDKDLLASENFVSTLLKVRQQVMKLQKG
ncbi:MAG: hypothetical protein KDD40_07070, partial [Bdellovibrionales bacterium]|nr:hypothetical protein [Bdellovibrionales bacterium]